MVGMTDWNNKLTTAILVSKKTASYVASTALDDWIMPYDILDNKFLEKGNQFASKFSAALSVSLGFNEISFSK